MGIKMQHCNGPTVNLIESAQSWKGYAVIAAQCKQFWLRVIRMSQSWFSRSKLQKGFTHLAKSKGIVKRCDGYIATIDDSVGRRIRIQTAARVEGTKWKLACRSSADGSRAEACSCFHN